MIDLDALEALAKKASPSPWRDVSDRTSALVSTPDGRMAIDCTRSGETPARDHDNACFIAACDPQTILMMIAEIKSLRGEHRD